MSSTNQYPDPFNNPNTAIHDLGAERFDHDVAAAGDRDYALRSSQPIVRVAKGRAEKGLEAQVFAWNTMQYTTEDKDEVAELKGDLHGGQLHRQNRIASGNGGPGGYSAGGMENFNSGGGRGGFGGRGNRGGRGGRGGGGAGRTPGQQEYEPLRAGMKPTDREVPPLSKGYAEELTADMFWNEPLFKD